MIFILLYVYWCYVIFLIRGIGMRNITDCCLKSDLNNQRNYGSLTCACWIVTILFVSIATALLTNALGGDIDTETFCEEFNLYCLEVMVMTTMWTVIGLFCCCNVCCYCVCIRQLVGQICGRDEHNDSQA